MPMPMRTNAVAPELSPLHEGRWRELIGRRCGLAFSDARLRVLRQALDERMRRLGCDDLGDYYRQVALDADGHAEWRQLLELLVNRETSFFRHAPAFDALTDHVMPQLRRDRPAGEPARLWSAGCSTGQEAYSLAMACLEAADGRGRGTRVLATDISADALGRARAGRYRARELRGLPAALQARYVPAAEGADADGSYRVCDVVRDLLHFAWFNLNEPATYPACGQDVIFCQNVLIHFPPEAREDVVGHLARCLNPGGYLFLGPAEAMGLRVTGLESVRLEGALIYRRGGP
jgi:chemotaxis methyl-accepting protein methylase